MKNVRSHATLLSGLKALVNLEHRGGTASDLLTGDGTGILTDIPRALLGMNDVDALANLFLPRDITNRVKSLRVFEETFAYLGLEVVGYREVPITRTVLSSVARASMPEFLMAIIRRPEQCTSRHSFEKSLYAAKQLTRSRLREAGIIKQFFFTSLSASTVVYKALTTSAKLPEFYRHLQNPEFVTRFVLFHRRFSTNTATAWDTAQPFRLVAHNGEINTISANRSWAYSRERALGLREDELLTHRGISDSGSVNEMIEALTFRGSIPHPEDILAIMMPQADNADSYYKFWSRAMEPWDGPALISYCDGRSIGARLDRSGFRPCRWARTADHFYLSSEAGSFGLADEEIIAKGGLTGGSSVNIRIERGTINFKDASRSRENLNASFDPRIVELPRTAESVSPDAHLLSRLALYGFSDEDLQKVIKPLIQSGKEGIGSMGDSARLAALSSETRSLFDFFYQRFAQVTNPPLDFLREKIVTEMTVILGRKPNIFEPKELIPMKAGIALPGPLLTLGQMENLKSLNHKAGFENDWADTYTLDSTYAVKDGAPGVLAKLESIRQKAVAAVRRNVSILIISDRGADEANPPIPALFVLRTILQEMNQQGRRLRVSIVVDSGEVKEVHSVAVLTAFGAAAVCPHLLLELARQHPTELLGEAAGSAEERELRLVQALEQGLLKVMSKAGISVFRSYQGSELFTLLGFSPEVHQLFFPQQRSLVGGLSFEQLIELTSRNFSKTPASSLKTKLGLVRNFLYQENLREAVGEKHSMTLSRSKLVHKLFKDTDAPSATHPIYEEYAKAGAETTAISVRHLLRFRPAETPLPSPQVESAEAILKKFGSGAMSFGAISAESQRDIFLAMNEIGGRSNSGEGGENPYYFSDGICAHTKQLASGRFGVTAEYLMTGRELQIKIAQGAKPGEGGQLMAVKVDEAIAKARFSDPGVDLISPPPMHDIYSIEDLKQLIYELRQLKPHGEISVKLVSGEFIGTIAVGVVKAGADIIQISGHDGGTGASPLGSMKHAGLPWEFGLWECHRALHAQGIRDTVRLRVDGGLFTGADIVMAAILGAEEFDFGKLLLIAEGCIMARICEKNTCPTGIATHDPKFKRLYRGNKDRIVRLLQFVAEDIRLQLSKVGVSSLRELVGRADLLEVDPVYAVRVKELGLDLSSFLNEALALGVKKPNPFVEKLSAANERITETACRADAPSKVVFPVHPSDRAVLATLNGVLGLKKATGRKQTPAEKYPASLPETFEFHGSAGQGFAVFLQPEMNVKLFGEANDSVAKSMSGGRLVIVPSTKARFRPSENMIIGNCALYGATGGTLFVNGVSGARFAVRNSGAVAVIEGVGIHACEYMTRGTVVILGDTGPNVGAGMTGGVLYLRKSNLPNLNAEYLVSSDLDSADEERLTGLLADYAHETGSETALGLLKIRSSLKDEFLKGVPITRPKIAAKAAPEPTSGVRQPATDDELVRVSETPR